MGKQPVIEDAKRQSFLEQRLQAIPGKELERQAASAVCGALESWELKLGKHRLLLHPAHKQWMIYDRLHDAWQPTGIAPGQGIFVVQGRRLGLQRTPSASPSPRPAAKFCPGCGKAVKRGQKFCNHCGRVLSKEAEHGNLP